MSDQTNNFIEHTNHGIYSLYIERNLSLKINNLL